jgi:hypothetical protein
MYTLYDDATFGTTPKIVKDAKCKLQYLTMVQNNYYAKMNVKETDNTPFQRFVTTCKGPVINTLKTVVLNRWLDRVERSKVIQKKRTKTHYIRIAPRSKIPEECVNLPQNKCKYPCAWNKYIGRCTDIPRGSYRPSDDDDDSKYIYK